MLLLGYSVSVFSFEIHYKHRGNLNHFLITKKGSVFKKTLVIKQGWYPEDVSEENFAFQVKEGERLAKPI